MKEIAFNVSARAARLIGRENFANAEGAVIELIKNSYDADASTCIIAINNTSNELLILDNGDGMDENTILDHWMTIGTDNKQDEIKTGNSRVKTGAKGIGRFALDRLGHACEMITKTEGESFATKWIVDWGQFEQKGKKISDIKASIDELPDFTLSEYANDLLEGYSDFKDLLSSWEKNKGTLIKIKKLKDAWTKVDIEELYSNLEMLVPPLEENQFRIFLLSSDTPEEFGNVESARCDDYDYKLEASLDEKKNVNIKIHRNELNIDELKRMDFFSSTKLDKSTYGIKSFKKGVVELNIPIENLIPGFKDIDSENNLDKIGPFNFSFYFMKRGGGQEKKDEGTAKYPYKHINYRDRSSWLKKFGGIKLYRDKFRVRPYGETNGSSFDWLGLGQRALQNPTVTRSGYGVRPQQIYGIVNISRIDNINFEDKSSREGLQENETFSVFKELLISIINKFENDRNQIMMSLYQIHQEKDKREKAKREADKKLEEENKSSKEKSDSDSDSSSENDSKDKETFKEAYKAAKEEIEELKDEQKLLKVLASAGLIVTSFAHELKNLSDRIVPRTDDLKEIIENLIDPKQMKALEDYNNPLIMLSDMRSQDERLKHWLDFALEAVRKNKRNRRKIDMVNYVEGLQRSWSSLLSRRHIELKVDKKNFLEVFFKGYEIDLDGIFNNLLANSVDSFRREDAPDTRWIKLSFLFDAKTGINVTYEDSGPRLSDDITDPNQIFEPFFTTKRDKRTGEKTGTGLGMWIVKSTMDEYDGSIEFIKTRPGFKLKLALPHA